MINALRLFPLLVLLAAASVSAREPLLVASPEGSFPLVNAAGAAPIIVERHAPASVARAVGDFRQDIQRVSGQLPSLQATPGTASLPAAVIVGVAGQSDLLRQLASAGKIDLTPLQGAWESFIIAVVEHPLPNVQQALVIAGSDARGAIYGCYELSQAIGVSPWHWWADVPPARRDTLLIARGTQRFGPPSVKYRGLFINDEDWGLQPWAAKTFEPEAGDLGPRTYAKVFELLLRLKANTLWPAMHPSTRPFNDFPANKDVARDFGIVMGSSHAEPMLRNNVGEWKEPAERYNYLENRDGVLGYWEKRVRENGAYDNIYTLGMRGIHDSGIQGKMTPAERIALLERIFADQRALLSRHVNPEVAAVPQMFCAYKEVLDLYRGGLKVPDDVTIVWPDDNFGYIRNFATPEEQKRRGGFGVYYHLSYLGAPMSYLWLNTIPPALIWEEMTKAYDHGARTIWIANVGDIKPAEIGIDFFLQLAWDVNAWNRTTLPQFLPQWAGRQFGGEQAAEIGDILARYFQLNFQRKPEHLQWWLPKKEPRPSAFSESEVETRLGAFAALQERVTRLEPAMPAAQRDAFYELVAYPVIGSALANARYFHGERAALHPETAPVSLAQAREADVALRRATRRYNDEIAGGKWRGLMQLDVAESEWPQFQIQSWKPPGFAAQARTTRGASPGIALEAEAYSRKIDRPGVAWETIPGLGRTGPGAVAVFPTTYRAPSPEDLRSHAPRLEFDVPIAHAGRYTLQVYLLPTHPLRPADGLRFGVALDDAAPRVVTAAIDDGSAAWAQGVLNSARRETLDLTLDRPGQHTLAIYGIDPGVVLDRIVIMPEGVEPGYLGTP